MKKSAFVIVAVLLVLGLVLPGCASSEEEEEQHFITIAVPGPMTISYGEFEWQGVTLAAEEINAAGGVNIGGVMHEIRLVKVDTNESFDITGTDGILALSAVIDDVDFVIGGFQETAEAAYREVAMDKGKIFIAAAVGAHQQAVLDDYERYKYWFQGSMINDEFVNDAFGKIFATAMAYGFQIGGDYTPRVAIVAEDEQWCDLAVEGTQYLLESMGWYAGTARISNTSTAEEVLAVLSQLAPEDPHFIFTIFSGPAGASFSKLIRQAVPYAVAVGNNNEATQAGYDARTTYDPNEPPGCAYEITMALFAPGIQVTPTSLSFANAYYDRWGTYPEIQASYYDHTKWLMQDVEKAAQQLGVSDIADVVSPENIDVLIKIHEQGTYVGAASTWRYYPMPIELDHEVTNPTSGTTTKYVLSEEQVNQLYPDLASYGITYDPALWTAPAHLPHSVVYGPGWTTGVAVQWQEVSPGEWGMVAVWPTPLFPDDPAYYETMMENGWINQWGYWNFSYPGSGSIQIPDWWIAHHFPG